MIYWFFSFMKNIVALCLVSIFALFDSSYSLARSKKKIVLAGSYRKYLKEVCDIKKNLEDSGYMVLEPSCGEVINQGSEFIVMKDNVSSGKKEITEEDMMKIEEKFLNSLRKADIVYVINKNGYIGLSAAMEIGFANAIKKPVYCLEEPSDYGLKVIKVCNKVQSIKQFLNH